VSAARAESRATEATRPNADTARATLARLTKSVHDNLHRQRSFARLMSESLAMADYRRLLARLYGFYAAFEDALRADADLDPEIDFCLVAKAPLLLADLVALGISWHEIEMVEKCRYMPPLQSQDEIVGAFYVVEGSGLGGKVIARKLDYLFGDNGPAGRRFFIGRRAPDPLPWTKFCHLLERRAEAGGLTAIANSALHTFETFELWMNEGECDV
jgi:heme oxygenase